MDNTYTVVHQIVLQIQMMNCRTKLYRRSPNYNGRHESMAQVLCEGNILQQAPGHHRRVNDARSLGACWICALQSLHGTVQLPGLVELHLLDQRLRLPIIGSVKTQCSNVDNAYDGGNLRQHRSGARRQLLDGKKTGNICHLQRTVQLFWPPSPL